LVINHYRKTSTRIQKPSTLLNRRIIYFSGKLLSSEDLENEQNYFNRRNLENITRHKPLYIIDLSSIFSKYIGETEKNLNTIFKKIKDMNGILLFDEADALFGKRSKIKDSHDKYANMETSYLLEKIQKYNGIILVTPNSKKPITKQRITKLDYVICMPIKKQK